MPDIPSVKVVGRYGITMLDGPDLDAEPDVIWCDSGAVVLTPLNSITKVAGGVPVPWTAGHAEMVLHVDSEGYVTLSGARVFRSVDLGSPAVNPTIPAGKATHKLTFRNMKANGTFVQFQETTVRLAADTVDPITGVCDLTLLTPVPTAGGTPIIVGPRGEQGDPGPEGPQGAPGGSDAATAEWIETGTASKAAVSAAVATRADRPTGRGAIAIVVDDAFADHFTDLLPLSLELGFPIGTAWPTNNGQDAAVADAWRKGWEILAHGHNHEDFSTKTEAEIDTLAQQMLAKITAITGGDGRNVAFVYPEHKRSASSDKALSRWFMLGRGLGDRQSVPSRSGHPWLISATLLDPEFLSGGGLSAKIKADLQSVAASDGRMNFYMHYGPGAPNALSGLHALVGYARSLGIAIVRPSQLLAESAVGNDRLIEQPSIWSLGAGWSIAGDQVYQGTQALKFSPNAAGGGVAAGVARQSQYHPLAHTAGQFLVARMSARYHLTAPLTGAVASFVALGTSRPVNGGMLAGGGQKALGAPMGATIPAGTWQRWSRVVAFGPEVAQILPGISLSSVPEGGAPIYFDDFRIDHLDSAGALAFDLSLTGTTGYQIRTGIFDVARHAVTLTPRASVAGRLYYTTDSADRITVYSTDPADTAPVRVTVMPTHSYADLTLTEAGA